MAHRVVCGALVGPKGVLLVHRRPDLAFYPNCWDFPGGHVGHGESRSVALQRELHEELGILATIEGEPRLRVTESPTSPDGFVLDLWIVREWSGSPANVATDEHDDIRWMTVNDVAGLQFAHASCSSLIVELTGAPARVRIR